MTSVVTIPVSPIRSDFVGFSQISALATRLKTYEFSSIDLDMREMTWCDGNMCAPLGASLYLISRTLNEISLLNLPAPVESLLSKNGFLTNYGRARRVDTYGSTIQYRRFEPQDDRVFSYYIDEQFRNKAIPEMSLALRKKFLEALMEIFSNAAIHSETVMGIFACGQYYHLQHRLDFTIADLGIGMRRNLMDKIGLQLPAEEAISWAMEGSNTTKTGPIPGGLGLKLLREFIRLNNGRLQVVSDAGYWEQHPDGRVDRIKMDSRFPGTVVNIEINTADQKSYALSNEQDDDIPF
jgi:hypothetical protein